MNFNQRLRLCMLLAISANSVYALDVVYQCQFKNGGTIKYQPQEHCRLKVYKDTMPYVSEFHDIKVQYTDLGIIVSSNNEHITKFTTHFIIPEIIWNIPQVNATQFSGIVIETDNSPTEFPFMKKRSRVIEVKECIAIRKIKDL